MYPRLKDGVDLQVWTHIETQEEVGVAVTPDGREIFLPDLLFRILMEADATRPLPVSDRLREKLLRDGLITTSRFRFGGWMNCLILWPVGRRAAYIRTFCGIANRWLKRLFLPVFLVGAAAWLYTLLSDGLWLNDASFFLFYVFFAVSVLLHEVGHLVSAVNAGYSVTEVGLLLFTVLPVGAYVAYHPKEDETDREKLELSLAGILFNLLLTGIFCLLAVLFPMLDFTFSTVALSNFLLVLVNILPNAGLDGEGALSALLGIQNVRRTAKACLSDRRERQRLLHSGAAGVICFLIYLFVVYVAKAAFLLFIGWNVVSLLQMIFT